MQKELSDISVETVEYVASKTYQLLQARDHINSDSHRRSVKHELSGIRKKREDLEFRLRLLELATQEVSNRSNIEHNEIGYRQIS